MIYEYSLMKIKGTYIKTYLAQITGEDEVWKLKRKFLNRTRTDSKDLQSYKYDIGGHGVFEISVKYFDKKTDDVISTYRSWFIYYRKRYYVLDQDDALFALYNLEAQYCFQALPADVQTIYC